MFQQSRLRYLSLHSFYQLFNKPSFSALEKRNCSDGEVYTVNGKEYCLEEVCAGGGESYCDAVTSCYDKGGWLADAATQEEMTVISNSATFQDLMQDAWVGFNGLGNRDVE